MDVMTPQACEFVNSKYRFLTDETLCFDGRMERTRTDRLASHNVRLMAYPSRELAASITTVF